MTRRVVLVGGLAVLGFGLEQLVTVGPAGEVFNALLWLAAVLAVHDGVLAPLAAGAGGVLARLGRRGTGWGAAVPVVGVGLGIGGVLVLVALPALLSAGLPDNPTVLPRPYGLGLTVLLGLDVAGTALAATGRVLMTRRRTAAG